VLVSYTICNLKSGDEKMKRKVNWESDGQAEVDFIIQNSDGDIIPIEVKAAENVRSRSLSVFIKKYKPPYAIRISGKNFGFENGIKSLPFYATWCL
jgi:uncharacterized protein